jgi:hypothetical protein
VDISPELAKQFDEAMQGIVPPELRAKGWRYIDPPTKFTPDAWDEFLRIIGEGEYEIICASEGHTKENGHEWTRGQLLVSPQGFKNMADAARKNEILGPR